MKTLILATFVILGLAGATSNAAPYHTPAHNFYQNNWMSGE
jgi:hypothetical protein